MRMDGKVVLITGANSGVGFATARQLAELGAVVIMVCRDPGRGSAARNAVAQVATGPEPTLLLADLSWQAAVNALSDEVHARFARIDELLNNAGAIFARRELTADGIEKTFAVNHLAPFLLTNLLLDLVRASPAGRIVTVASESHSGRLDFDNLQGERRWVRNLRAAGEAVLTRGWRRQAVVAVELTPEEAVPVLKDAVAPYLSSPVAAVVLRPQFDVAPDASLSDFLSEARRHPVFEVRDSHAA